jgi:hypothetical protein
VTGPVAPGADPGRPNPASRPASRRPTSRRLDPQGKQALFDAPVQAPPDHLSPGTGRDGRHALYSTGPREAGTVVVSCKSCGARSRTSLVDLGLRFLPFTAWLPARRYPHLMRCPACRHRTWCRIGWTD